MDDRDDDWGPPDRAPIKPRSLGRGLPVPPVLPIVAAICVFLGLAMGYRIAPSPTPTEAPPSIVAEATETPAGSDNPTAPVQPLQTPRVGFVDASPPTGGMDMDKLLESLSGRTWGISTASVVSARVAHYNEVSTVHATSRQWVWVVNFRSHYSFMLPGEGCPAAPSVAPDPSTAACPSVEATWTVILDYLTGDFLEAENWPVP